MSHPVIFLDDGGVISDNSVRAPQWKRLVGEFFAPRLGGTLQAWAEANHAVATALFKPDAWNARLNAARDYRSFERAYFLHWLAAMCDLVGIPRLPDDESVQLSVQATAWITSRIKADFPGAAEAIRLMHSRGYLLHTASGEASTDLEGYLSAIGVRDCFSRLYGPDLINTLKAGPEFYERLLADSGVAPADAIIVDDNLSMVINAAQAGARTVLVTREEPPPTPGLIRAIGSLAELPALLASIS